MLILKGTENSLLYLRHISGCQHTPNLSHPTEISSLRENLIAQGAAASTARDSGAQRMSQRPGVPLVLFDPEMPQPPYLSAYNVLQKMEKMGYRFF